MPTGTPSDLFTNSVSIETMEEEDTANNVLFKSVPMYQYLYLGICLEENEYSRRLIPLQPIFQNLRQPMKCLKSI